MDLSEYMVQRIKENPDKFYLILEPEMVNVSFWYIPKRLRGITHNKNREQELGKVGIIILIFIVQKTTDHNFLSAQLYFPAHGGKHQKSWIQTFV